MKQIDKDNFRFQCSGRTIHANQGIIGIDPEGNLFGGYDDELETYYGSLTADERHELAEHMIKRWQKFQAGF